MKSINSNYRTGLLFLICVGIFAFTSCDSTEYRESKYGTFVIKNVKGKKIWGLSERNPSSSERKMYLPCEYDSIYCHQELDHIYVAISEGKEYYFDYISENFMFDKTPVVKYVANHDLYNGRSNSTYGNLYHEIHTLNGIFYLTYHSAEVKYEYFGPFEKFFNSGSGYAYKKNGKWGFMEQKKIIVDKNIWNPKYHIEYIPLLAAKYDGIIEVSAGGSPFLNGGSTHYFLVKENGKWRTVDFVTKEYINKPQRIINRLLDRPVLSSYDFSSNQYINDLQYNYKRIGGEDFGYITIRTYAEF